MWIEANERMNPINSALLIKESCTRSDSNIISRESEKLIQLIHDKQFHLIMIGHPHEFSLGENKISLIEQRRTQVEFPTSLSEYTLIYCSILNKINLSIEV